MNTYGYVYGNALKYTDPLGLCGLFTPVCGWIVANAPAINTAGIIVAETAAGVGIASIGRRAAGPAIHNVYIGIRGGKPVYTGITNNLIRRTAEHCPVRFDELYQLNSPLQMLTRDQARAVEQVIMNNNPGFRNINNSIAPYRDWSGEAIDWGRFYLGL